MKLREKRKPNNKGNSTQNVEMIDDDDLGAEDECEEDDDQDDEDFDYIEDKLLAQNNISGNQLERGLLQNIADPIDKSLRRQRV